MNWDAIGAIGEIVGAGAVVVSLAYLAVQIRAQNRQARTDAIHEISIGFRETVGKFGSGEMADILVRGNEDFDSLSESETLQLIINLAAILRAWEEAFMRYEDKSLDQRSWDTMTNYYSFILNAPAFQKAWALRKDQFDSAFCAYVDSLPAREYRLK